MSNDLIPFPLNSSIQDALSLYLGKSSSPHGFIPSKRQITLFNSISEKSSHSFSDETLKLSKQITNLTIPPSPTSLAFVPSNKSIEEKLFDATASVKVLASKVAMHLDKDRRNKIFKQIDSLHDIAEWDEEDKPIRGSSFETFLKAILLISPQQHPGLGLSHDGYLIASWGNNQDRLTTEFLPKDLVHFVLSRIIDGETERISGQTTVARLYECLVPYQPNHWFAHE